MSTLIVNGLIVTPGGEIDAELLIAHGKIAAILAHGSPLPTANEIIDASGLVVMPGAIDVHTHFTAAHDFPEQELREGTRGAAAHGVTTIIEMPHSSPPATTLDSFIAKREMLARNCVVDFALWAGLDGENLSQLAKMQQAGAIAFKAFLCSDSPDGAACDEKGLPRLNDDILLRTMRELASFNGLIGVHAENHDILIGAASEQRAIRRNHNRAYALASPEIAETEAVGRVLHFARQTGVRTHIVHVSSAQAVQMITAARPAVRVSCETCPHYLLLDENDLVRMGANVRCSPPLRPRPVVNALWQRVHNGEIDVLASDHYPCTPEQKRLGQNGIWDAVKGLTGVETLGPLMFSEGHIRRAMPLSEVARMTASGPAQVFHLWPRKGAITLGADADLVLYDPHENWTVSGEKFHGLGKWSPFDGMKCRGKVVCTLIRGITVFRDGAIQVTPGFGQFLTRTF
ncbi:allantoinase AllB [Erwiniaceae bacterium BAC15a-03b]|uniref:allantoinase n=1 Tax=Winslowiella arboricola TaxID=2978220 RepID=A0A9J6PQ47_9GAMM|nr:allantoinase AllB [Winslowiella arboricola]MCU5772311.1 allantoinase AllB [Winslowiella arboricola]MCU5776175.1 allantoinase AllB [Winslowiella arboricola]